MKSIILTILLLYYSNSMWHCAARLLDYIIILHERNIITIYLLSKHGEVEAGILFILKV